ncbi:MAG: S1 RNA-binding domain-containing protein [Planctomycetaceae bacterium]|nr:S1 RNA-binding domain-containing protein [Planctomycetaceae bacterium]
MSNDSSLQEDSRPKILIGSQRNPDQYRPKPAIPAVDPQQPQQAPASPSKKQRDFSREDDKPAHTPHPRRGSEGESADELQADHLSDDGLSALKDVPLRTGHKVPVPSIRGKLSDDLEDEFSELFQGTEMESLMAGVDKIASQAQLEPETKLKGKILSVGNEDVFFDVGGRDQGTVPLKQFKELPEVGQEWDVIVLKYLPVEGLYELTLPLAAADVREWEQIQEGMILTAKITAVNTGGLECEVNKLRGFIPMGQIAVYRVEKPEDYVGDVLQCVVMEVNPMRRNLILSRRVMIEREREEMQQKLLEELQVGQVREGVVRKLIESGAFVDLGGVDGFIPIGALSWGRIKHPNEVLTEGARIKVKVSRMDPDTKRISLIFRDDADNPWSNIHERFQEKSQARGKVTRIMDFGAFVELMPGVEGLIHISELSHKRVGSVAEVLKVGEWVNVYIQSIDSTAKRVGLSIKQLVPEAQPETPADSEALARDENTPKKAESFGKPVKNQHKGPLRGGIGAQSDGDKFGLKW